MVQGGSMTDKTNMLKTIKRLILFALFQGLLNSGDKRKRK